MHIVSKHDRPLVGSSSGSTNNCRSVRHFLTGRVPATHNSKNNTEESRLTPLRRWHRILSGFYSTCSARAWGSTIVSHTLEPHSNVAISHDTSSRTLNTFRHDSQCRMRIYKRPHKLVVPSQRYCPRTAATLPGATNIRYDEALTDYVTIV